MNNKNIDAAKLNSALSLVNERLVLRDSPKVELFMGNDS